MNQKETAAMLHDLAGQIHDNSERDRRNSERLFAKIDALEAALAEAPATDPGVDAAFGELKTEVTAQREAIDLETLKLDGPAETPAETPAEPVPVEQVFSE